MFFSFLPVSSYINRHHIVNILKVRLEFYHWEEEIGHYSRLLIELNKFTKFGSAAGVLVLN